MPAVFKTGIPLLDHYLGGGLPRGTASIYGATDVGATSLSLAIAREAAIEGATTAFISLKGGTSPQYIKAHCGDSCAYSRPRFGEEALEQAATLVESGVSVIILDPLDGLVPLADMGDMIGTRDPSDQYRLVYLGLQTLRDLAMKCNALVVTTSEVRTLLPTHKLVPTYRNAVWDSANSLINLKQISYTSEYGTVLFKHCCATLEKCLLAPPMAEFNFKLWDKKGVDRATELMQALMSLEMITTRGPYCSFNGELLGMGFAKTRDVIHQRYDEFYEALMENAWKR